MFVNIVSDERALAKENLKGNTELEWHIDKGYSENHQSMLKHIQLT